MVKKIRFFIISYLCFLVLSIFSCNDGCGPFPDKSKVINIVFSTHQITFEQSSGGSVLHISDIQENTVPYSKFSIFLESQKEMYYSMRQKSFSMSLINTAYACSPAFPETNDILEDIEVITHNDFNENYLAGENIAPLFDVIVTDEFNYIYNEKMDLELYLATSPRVPEKMILILKEAPLELTEHVFTVKYYQDGLDIDYLEFETPAVQLEL